MKWEITYSKASWVAINAIPVILLLSINAIVLFLIGIPISQFPAAIFLFILVAPILAFFVFTLLPVRVPR